jgi:hypothetical protein
MKHLDENRKLKYDIEDHRNQRETRGDVASVVSGVQNEGKELAKNRRENARKDQQIAHL